MTGLGARKPAIERWEKEGGATLEGRAETVRPKKLVVFDLDGTIAESKGAVDIESARVTAIAELYASFLDDHPIDVIRVAGVPRAADAHAILDGLGRMVWGSRSAQGLRTN
jgi:hypothetical protein